MLFQLIGSSSLRSASESLPRLRIPSQTVQCRLKHSARQRKRLFGKSNPARARVQSRLQGTSNAVQGQEVPLRPPQFTPVIQNPVTRPNGWNPPPPDDVEIPSYPFRVMRTSQKPGGTVGFLPVYSYRQNTKITTRIKKVTGDQGVFLEELRSVLNVPAPQNPRFDAIRVRTGGTIEVDGNRVRDVKEWLAGLGF